jgi:hypothetical protein
MTRRPIIVAISVIGVGVLAGVPAYAGRTHEILKMRWTQRAWRRGKLHAWLGSDNQHTKKQSRRASRESAGGMNPQFATIERSQTAFPPEIAGVESLVQVGIGEPDSANQFD